MATGNINVTAENIFPIIKKFLYSDHEIFLRELISNATDATLKLKHLSTLGEVKGDIGNPLIEIIIDKVPATQKLVLASKLTNPFGWYMPIEEKELERNNNLVQNPYYADYTSD